MAVRQTVQTSRALAGHEFAAWCFFATPLSEVWGERMLAREKLMTNRTDECVFLGYIRSDAQYFITLFGNSKVQYNVDDEKCSCSSFRCLESISKSRMVLQLRQTPRNPSSNRCSSSNHHCRSVLSEISKTSGIGKVPHDA